MFTGSGGGGGDGVEVEINSPIVGLTKWDNYISNKTAV